MRALRSPNFQQRRGPPREWPRAAFGDACVYRLVVPQGSFAHASQAPERDVSMTMRISFVFSNLRSATEASRLRSTNVRPTSLANPPAQVVQLWDRRSVRSRCFRSLLA